MIALPPGARVWLVCGATDMRRGMPGLALMVQEALGRNPHAGDLFVFRGKQGSLLKILWHDGVGMSLYAKRLEKGRFIWPTPKDASKPFSQGETHGRVAAMRGGEGPEGVGRDLRGAARLHAGRDRLAEPAPDLAAASGGISAAAAEISRQVSDSMR